MRSFGIPETTALVMPPSASTSSISAQAALGQLRRQALDVVGPRQRIDDMGDPGLLLQDQLGVARDPRREFRRQRNRFVERVRVQALRAAERRRHRLVGGAHDVVVGILLLQADARWSGNASAASGSPASSPRTPVMIRCQSSRAARSFATSMKKFMPMAKKKRQPPGEGVDVHPRRDRRPSRTPCRPPA